MAILLTAVNVSTLFSQSSTGTVLGTVRDPTGAPVPETHVKLTNLGTGVTLQFTTDDTGNYYFPSLIPGRYQVEAEKPGFRKITVSDLRVEVNQSARVDLALSLGQLTQEVIVEASGLLVQTDAVTLGQVVSNRQVSELPLNGRDFTNLLRLNAGVSEVQGGIITSTNIRRHGLNDNFRNVSVNGARPASISFLIDGVTNNDGMFQTAVVIPPIDTIQEFKLQNGLYSAEFGLGSAQVNVALRSGTNQVHGSLWNFLRNDALQPYHPRFQTKTPLKQNQFGVTAGGPAWLPRLYDGRNRTFFFGSYEGGRRRTGSIGQGQMPTEQQRRGDFSDWPTQLHDPLSGVANPGGTPVVIRQPFTNNRIPATMLAQTSLNFLKYFPAPNVSCALPCNNFVRSFAGAINVDTYTSRIDHNLGDADRLFGQFVYQNDNGLNPRFIPLSGSTGIQNSRLAGLQWTHVFSSRSLNELRTGFSRQRFLNTFETSFGPTTYWKEAGLKNLVDTPLNRALPQIIPGTGYSSLGASGSVPFHTVANTVHFVDAVTLTRGRNSIKFGADFRRHLDRRESGDAAQGGCGSWAGTRRVIR